MQRFVFDSLVDQENILNQKQVIERLTAYSQVGVNAVLYGRRNTAKTSIIKNLIIPRWEAKYKGLAIYCDFMYVKDIQDISERMTHAFNQACNSSSRLKKYLDDGIRFIKGLKPTFEIGSDGSTQFSIKSADSDLSVDFDLLLKNIGHLHSKGTKCLLCFDEFQDIALVKTAEAKLRKSLQELPDDLCVVILGSKQHLLTDIFEKPRAPFYQWGQRVGMQEISNIEYNEYLRQRLKPDLAATSDEVLIYWQNALFRHPEAIHRVGFEANLLLSDPLTESDIDQLILDYVGQNQSFFETKLHNYSKAEVSFLTKIAKANEARIATPHGQALLAKIPISSAGMTKMVRKLLNDGIIERDAGGLGITDPFLIHFLKNHR